ncbi:hypothetical protein NA57DRAFT_60439 [Rhizodiscina lignyota]|uniref:Extracellular membrane protein CFEM domain-containing protein n=1 Tax=Rhizodiscina lignyota TaxID=1504668 RepID=A0A9P4I5S9_9PEZI|nr:hypothetical protein NA57DRAFT_60439 [Rhizodiscina lignyota]
MLAQGSFRILLSIITFLSALAAAQQSFIFELPSYTSAKGCIQKCVSQGSITGINSFGCNVGSPASCLCSAKPSSFVSSYGFTCASSACGNVDDASAASRIWSSYCVVNSALPAAAGMETGVPTAGSTPTDSPASGSTPGPATPTPTTGAASKTLGLAHSGTLALGVVVGISLPALLMSV